MTQTLAIMTVTALALVTSGCATPFYMGQQPSTHYDRPADHMPESIRKWVRSVSVTADPSAPTLYVGGDFGKEMPTTGEGAAAGAGAGVGFTGEMLVEDPRSLILVPFVLPIAVVAGTVVGAAGAKIEQEIQQFRDGLTEDLSESGDTALPGAALAETLRGHLEFVTGLDVGDADTAAASLAIEVTEVSIIVEENDATITTEVIATLRDSESGSALYTNSFSYSDRDTLRSWTADNNALWDVYVDNARQRISRDISEHFFETIVTRHVLRPVHTASQAGTRNSNGWDTQLKANTPTLGWELFLLGGDDYDEWRLDERPTTFDLEIYDGARVIYSARRIEGTRHDVTESLPSCRTLYWTVRPVYTIDGRTRAGEWMYRHAAGERAMNEKGATFSGDIRDAWEGFAKIRTGCKKS